MVLTHLILSTFANSGNARDSGSIPRSGRFPGEENGNPLRYSGLGDRTDSGAWGATVHGVAKSQTRLSKWVRMHAFVQNILVHPKCLQTKRGTSLVTQWLRLFAPSAGGPGSIPGQRTRSSCLLRLSVWMLQPEDLKRYEQRCHKPQQRLKIPCVWHSQINI